MAAELQGVFSFLFSLSSTFFFFKKKKRNFKASIVTKRGALAMGFKLLGFVFGFLLFPVVAKQYTHSLSVYLYARKQYHATSPCPKLYATLNQNESSGSDGFSHTSHVGKTAPLALLPPSPPSSSVAFPNPPNLISSAHPKARKQPG